MYANSGVNSVAVCLATCYRNGYIYAGVEASNECYCGNSLRSNTGTPDRQSDPCSVNGNTAGCVCNQVCTGNSGEYCGGAWAIDIYGPPNYSYKGCYHDGDGGAGNGDGGKRIMSTRLYYQYPLNSVEFCVSTCNNGGYRFAGVEASDECWCSNTLTRVLLNFGNYFNPEDRQHTQPCNSTTNCACTYNCTGNAATGLNEKCGGAWAIDIYTIMPTPLPKNPCKLPLFLS